MALPSTLSDSADGRLRGLTQVDFRRSVSRETASRLVQKEIQRALDNLVRGRTTIAIAHRLSTLRKADRLVVMDKGVVVEEGTHDVLIEAQGAYWRLYEAQQRQAEADTVLGGSLSTEQKVKA
jgi:ATP-binding cassette subfamily B protein